MKKKNKNLFYLLNGEVIDLEPNTEVNNYGYKLMGYLNTNKEKCLVFDGKNCIVMSVEEFMNFSRERKLQFILNK